jgi:hypothetical protein
MMTTLVLSLLLAFAPSAQQESKPIPKDSVEISSPGCLKGRVFTATPPREGELTREGPDVTGRHFRVSGPREVTDLIKRYNGQLVEIVGIVQKGALAEYGTGMKVGKGARVVIGAPRADPSHTNMNTMTPSMPVMDVTAVRFLSDRCPIE